LNNPPVQVNKYQNAAARLGWYLRDLVKRKGTIVEPDDGSIELKKGKDGVYSHDNADGYS
jgi:hypothetical protein